MNAGFLMIEVNLHQPQWQGAKEWPPSPWRLFQALVAAGGLGRGEAVVADEARALDWLERLDPPVVAAPAHRHGQAVKMFLPNNDLDVVDGRLWRVSEIRKAKKMIQPALLPEPEPFRFIWAVEESQAADQLVALTALCHRLYQFGRGEDMAYARVRLHCGELDWLLEGHRGPVYRANAGGGESLRCPVEGSRAELVARHHLQRDRLAGGLFRQVPPARHRLVGYGTSADHLLFELRGTDGFHPWPLARAGALVEGIRDRVGARLGAAGMHSETVERVVVGRRSAIDDDKARRVQIWPLPSIGSSHADGSVRRVVLSRPPECPISAADLSWAMSGLDMGTDYSTGEIRGEGGPFLIAAEERGMLRHYGIGETGAREWRTVTPAALCAPNPSGRQNGGDRITSERAVVRELAQAVRHAGIGSALVGARVQREPFVAGGDRAETFAWGPRFTREILWHCALEFASPVAGPVVVGHGRYLGLGVCAPAAAQPRDFVLWGIAREAQPGVEQRAILLSALRRALMSLAADRLGDVPTLFSGHETGPEPARGGSHRHVYLLALDRDGDGKIDMVGAFAPWSPDRSWQPQASERRLFGDVTMRLRELVAGAAGRFNLEPIEDTPATDPLLMQCPIWRSATPYATTRHAHRRQDWSRLVREDIEVECVRRGLPPPAVHDIEARGCVGGVEARVCLHFPFPVPGPLALGRTAHAGGGWFVAEPA